MTLLAALFSHYRRHPLQLLALAAMIVLATMLWAGVHHLTSQARVSLERSESAVAERQQVVRADGQPVSVQDFVELRRAGLCVMPWLEVAAPGTGRVVGVDPLAAACFESVAGAGEPWHGELDGAPFVDISEAAGLADDQPGELSLLVSGAGTEGEPALAIRVFAESKVRVASAEAYQEPHPDRLEQIWRPETHSRQAPPGILVDETKIADAAGR